MMKVLKIKSAFICIRKLFFHHYQQNNGTATNLITNWPFLLADFNSFHISSNPQIKKNIKSCSLRLLFPLRGLPSRPFVTVTKRKDKKQITMTLIRVDWTYENGSRTLRLFSARWGLSICPQFCCTLGYDSQRVSAAVMAEGEGKVIAEEEQQGERIMT